MRRTDFDELGFFKAIQECGARTLLIGRRALVLLGLPLLTADYDFWIASEDIERFNAALEPLDLVPTEPPDEARRRGRYGLENDEHVDVVVARALPLPGGGAVVFEEIWPRRQAIPLNTQVSVAISSLDDLVATKRVGGRPKDLEDIRQLRILRQDQP